MLDKWSVLPEQVAFLEELGQGAFGKVHRAKVMSFKKAMERRRSGDAAPVLGGKIVAVKVLRGEWRVKETSNLLRMQFPFFQ